MLVTLYKLDFDGMDKNYEDAQNTMLEVYPNPTNSQVMLEYTKAGIHLGCQYKIYNQQGKLIIKETCQIRC